MPAPGMVRMPEIMRSMSPAPGCSTLTTSAPKSASIMAAAGAAITVAASTTFRPESR